MKDKFNPSAVTDKVKELKEVLKGAKGAIKSVLHEETTPEEKAPQADDDIKSIQKKLKSAEEQLAVVTEKLKEAEQDKKHHKDEYLRTLAEFENFRKRMTREKDDLVKFGLHKFLKDLLPVYDHLEMTIAHAEGESANKGVVDGVKLVLKEFTGTLEKLGLKTVEGEGSSFDPHRHEAIGSVPTDEHKPGEVVTVHRKGFLLHDRLIRPALVTVAKAAELPEEASDTEVTSH